MGIVNGLEVFPASLASFSLLLSKLFTQEPQAFSPVEEEVGLGGKIRLSPPHDRQLLGVHWDISGCSLASSPQS